MLQDSPLAPSLGAGFADLQGSGPVTGELAMYLPIKEFDQRVITVMRTLDGVTLQHRQQPYRGRRRDRRSSGSATGRSQAPTLTGRVLGGPLAGLDQDDDADERRISARGEGAGHRGGGSALLPVARLPVNAGLAGTADWRGFLTVERSVDRERACAWDDAALSSDLRGLASALPEPFDKAAELARRSTIAASFDGISGPRIEGSLGRDVHALVQWRSKADDPPIERGIVAVRRRCARCAAEERRPLAHRPARVGESHGAGRSEVGRAAWPPDPGLARRRRPRDRPLRGGRLRIRRASSGRLRPGNRAWDVDVKGDGGERTPLVPFTFPGEVPAGA